MARYIIITKGRSRYRMQTMTHRDMSHLSAGDLNFEDAIPIIAYHDIDYDKEMDSTDINLFDQEMKYLHDNGFKVIKMSDLGYDENTKYLYIK